MNDIEWLSLNMRTKKKSKRAEIEHNTTILNNLSDKEIAVYFAVKGQNNSFAGAAEILGISKSMVKSYVDRARTKLDKQIQYGSQNFYL